MWFGWPEGPFFVLAFLLNLAFWGGLVFLIVWAVKRFRPSAGPQAREDPAMRILEERFARGEIDADEYQRRCEVLKGSAREFRGGPGAPRSSGRYPPRC